MSCLHGAPGWGREGSSLGREQGLGCNYQAELSWWVQPHRRRLLTPPDPYFLLILAGPLALHLSASPARKLAPNSWLTPPVATQSSPIREAGLGRWMKHHSLPALPSATGGRKMS